MCIYIYVCLGYIYKYCYAQCPNPREGREKTSKTMQLAKREVYCLLELGLPPHPMQWCRSESPEPKLLQKFLGWAHTVGSWFKQNGYRFAKQFHWSKLSIAGLSGGGGGFRPIPNWQTAVCVKLIQVAW